MNERPTTRLNSKTDSRISRESYYNLIYPNYFAISSNFICPLFQLASIKLRMDILKRVIRISLRLTLLQVAQTWLEIFIKFLSETFDDFHRLPLRVRIVTVIFRLVAFFHATRDKFTVVSTPVQREPHKEANKTGHRIMNPTRFLYLFPRLISF